ncbi:MAG: hypothetical protein QOI21_2482 [Actinomycetota bacterium]|nr:hypothetical protein [Actinomycetota bacterium]
MAPSGQVLLADTRVRAGSAVSLLGREVQHTPSGPDPTWPETWSHLTGRKRWLTVADAGHAGFTDVFALTDQLGISPLRADPSQSEVAFWS